MSPLPCLPTPNPSLSVTLITLNEESKLAEAILSVRALAAEVIVIDSGSQDKTRELARSLGARVIEQKWLGYGQQKNFAHSQCRFDWVLNLDADERLTEELREEIRSLLTNPTQPRHEGYHFPRKTFYLGKWIRFGGWYPNRAIRLTKKSSGVWTDPAVHERLQVEGSVGGLKGDLLHYPFQGIQDQVLTNLRFSQLGSLELKKGGTRPRISSLLYKPIGKFLETYLWKFGFLDGLAGFIISVNAAHSAFLKYAYLFEKVSSLERLPAKREVSIAGKEYKYENINY